jgi:hypothetical protein
MSDKKKRTPQTAYSSTKEWESLQPQRDEVKAEINKNSVKPINWTLLHNSRTAVKREKAEFNKQNKTGAKFQQELVDNIVAPIAERMLGSYKDYPLNVTKVGSFKY